MGSRIARYPVLLSGVTCTISSNQLMVKGKLGELNFAIHPAVLVEHNESANTLLFSPVPNVANSDALTGTTRALANNMVLGVTQGFEKKLLLVGVGYRASVQGNTLNLSLGFSHPVERAIPDGIKITTPSATEILISGIDKQKVGQVAAHIRAIRPPEPYKGKGIRYSDEVIIRKEAKKK